MKFKKQHLREILAGDRGEVIHDAIIEHSRWSIKHRLIFTDKTHPRKFFKSFYSIGATEYQAEMPWRYLMEMKSNAKKFFQWRKR